MESHLETDLDVLKQRLLTMANHAEKAVTEALQALDQRDDDLALQVKQSDRVINRFEIEIDDLVIQQLIKAPLATDLRTVTASVKISHNLERIGDEAKKIAKHAIELSGQPPIDIKLDIPCMASLTLEMLKLSLDAFSHRDPAAARALIPRDKEVDVLNKQVHQMLSQHMAKHPNAIQRCLDWMAVSKSLERIADHATNIAEDVVYLCEARHIRHTGVKRGMPSLATA
ncbi:MAG TPA: phosphate signaling complex protein PhoU [Candidatus Acidoferrales bacterium]|jgi:phosphate transport system protein|nr:phosphate signaling complex protein PhoU [Candidatus Acidoferrales bacterium]